MYGEVLERLEAGATLLTVNQRLARTLHSQYNRIQEKAGLDVWQRPDILSFGAWMQGAFDAVVERLRSGEAPPVLLSQGQENALWEQVIAASVHGERLLNIAGAARSASEAYRVTQEWQIRLDENEGALNEDATAFLNWSRAFDLHCEGENWLSRARLADFLTRSIQIGRLALPQSMLLAGFDELSPALDRLWSAIQSRAHDSRRIEIAAARPSGRRVALRSGEDEIRAAAAWARYHLENGLPQDGVLGVVVPALTDQRRMIERIFTEMLAPGSVVPGTSATPRLFNISLARSLREYPLIDAAFLIWELATGSIDWQGAGKLLRSPFIADGISESQARACADERLRKSGWLRIDIDGLAGFSSVCPVFRGVISALKSEIVNLPSRQSPGGLASALYRLLKAAGWPGERRLTSDEFQTAERLKKLLADYASLDLVVSMESLSDAVLRVGRMAGETLFQPKTEAAPIQILGTLEATAMRFERLWITGLHDGAWPGPPRPNPFIPFHLQQAKNIPHCTAARELTFAGNVTERLLAGSEDVIVSWPEREEDRELVPSALITHLPQIWPDDLPTGIYKSILQVAVAGAQLEEVPDGEAPPLTEGTETVHVRGGTRVFQLQAVCPFRAFAELRLHAEPLEAPAGGLDARQRGSLVHRSLQIFWSRLKESAALNGDVTALENAAQVAVDEAMTEVDGSFEKNFLDIERERLVQLLLRLALVEHERATDTSFVVQSSEERRLLSAGGITVDGRVDRIDVLPDGRKIYLDYKTGRKTPKAWFGERPDEPQLPLYCISEDGEIAGAAFVNVSASCVEFNGVISEGGELQPARYPSTRRKLKPEYRSMEEMLGQWRKTLDRLGQEFRDGHAPVDPKNTNTSCRYCHVTPLCRIHESERDAADEEDDAD